MRRAIAHVAATVALIVLLRPALAKAQGEPDSSPVAPAASSLMPCTLARVADADTIECVEQGRVRLIGIDAPERNQEPFGGEATAAARALLHPGARLRLETDRERRDRYGRLLAYAWLDDVMVNWLLVRRGWAVSYRYRPNVRYAAVLDRAEQHARGDRAGLWRIDGFRCRPLDHRRSKC